jgi:hypothetical protein
MSGQKRYAKSSCSVPVEPGAAHIIKWKTIDRRFASEALAQDFAERWCRELWSQPFDHPDPIHSPPSPDELEAVRGGWAAANGDYKTGLLRKQAQRYDGAVEFLTRAVGRFPAHALALELLGGLTYAGLGTTQSSPRKSSRQTRGDRSRVNSSR